MAPYSSNIYKEEEIVSHLTKLILSNIHIDRWIFKINGKSEGRGLAYFDIMSVQKLKAIRKKISSSDPEELFKRTQNLLLRFLPKKLKIVRNNLYRDFEEYIEEFTRKGGMIEASPSLVQKDMGSPGLSFFIEPTGQVRFLSSFEKIYASLMTPCGYEIPQRSLPNINVSTPTHFGISSKTNSPHISPNKFFSKLHSSFSASKISDFFIIFWPFSGNFQFS